MAKIIFTSSWGEDSSSLLDRYRLQTPGNKGTWDNLEGTDNPDEADYCVVMQDDDEKRIPWNKKIYLKREPRWTVSRSFEDKKALYKFTYDTGYHVSVWWVKNTYDELHAMENKKEKKRLCCIASGITETSGHRERLEFVQKLANSDIDIDIYGRGLEKKCLGDKYKGECRDKGEVLFNYDYSIAIENGRCDNYFSEKFCDVLLAWGIPIYWGCPNVDKYFPSESFRTINIREDGVDQVRDIVSKAPSIEQISAVGIARKRILDKYNVWPAVKHIIETGEMNAAS